MEDLPDGVRGVDLTRPPSRMSAVTLADGLVPPTKRDKYRVTLVFRHPTQSAGLSSEELRSVDAEGDSGLVVPAGRATFVAEDPQAEGGELRIAFEANRAGRLGRAISEITVDGAPLARRIVTTHVGAILARLAYETGALVVIRWIEVLPAAGGHTERGFLFRGGDVSLELQDDPMIVQPFRSWISKNIFWVADELHSEFRVPLAHGVTPDEPMLAADQMGVESRHWLARPVAQQVARTLLQDVREIRALFGPDPIPELDKASFA